MSDDIEALKAELRAARREARNERNLRMNIEQFHNECMEEAAIKLRAMEIRAQVAENKLANDSITGGGTPYRECTGSALALAKQFHDTYERLAPKYGYETRPDTRQFDADSPNGRLMVAVCREIIEQNPAVSGAHGAAE